MSGPIQPKHPDAQAEAARCTGSFLLRRHWGLVAVLAFWSALFAVNVLDLAPSVTFRGVRYGGGDFCQYYIGGVVAHERTWDDLYPLDLAVAPRPDKSTISPRLADSMERRNAGVSWKFIYPPSLAVFFVPFDLIPFAAARKVFTCLLFGAVAWFLALFRRECDDWNLPTFLSNFLVFAVGTGLPVCESVMMANATPLMALASLLALRSIRKNRVAGSVFAFALAGLFKGISAFWIPALFLWRKWRILVAGTVAGAVVFALPQVFGASFDLWERFFREIVPGSRKLYWIGDGNLGLPSFLAWLSGGGDLPAALKRVLDVSQVVILAAAYALARKSSRNDSGRAEGLALFVATLVFQLFSPICWPHYAFNVVGFLPLALSTAGVRNGTVLDARRRISVAIVGLAFVLAWFPVGNAAKYVFHAPVLGFGRTFGYLLALGWGIAALFRKQVGETPHAR